MNVGDVRKVCPYTASKSIRLCVVHNYHRSHVPSGEDAAVDIEVEALNAHPSIQLSIFRRSNDEVNVRPIGVRFEAAIMQVWNVASLRALGEVILRDRVDIVHIHNTFPLISLGAMQVAKSHGAMVVWTAHNFRPWCIASSFMRDGVKCTLCVDQASILPGIENACYGDSVVLSMLSGLAGLYHQRVGTIRHHVDAILAVSEFQRKSLIALGLDDRKIKIKPNVVRTKAPVPFLERTIDLVFLGRLSEEKGIRILLEALKRCKDYGISVKAVIVGDGPLKAEIESRARADLLDLSVLGMQEHGEAMRILAGARLLVAPSLVEETFGMSVAEAFSLGVPAITSDRGGVVEHQSKVAPGMIYPADSSPDLAALIMSLFEDRQRWEALSKDVHRYFLDSMTATVQTEKLIDVYRSLLQHRES